jgi:hypothetical protein
MKNEKIEEIEATFGEIAELTEVIVNALDKNPKLEEAVTRLLSKYMGVLWPVVQEAAEITIKVRKQAFVEFKAMGLSDEHAIQLVNGR